MMEQPATVHNPRGSVSSTALCSFCRVIDFDRLRVPTQSDIDGLRSGSVSSLILSKGISEATRCNLGLLLEVKRRASTCPLCALFCKIIGKQVTQPGEPLSLRIFDDPDVRAVANVFDSYYAKIYSAAGLGPVYFVMRRLTLLLYSVKSPDYAFGYFEHALQACEIGASAAPTDLPALQARQAAGGMPFSGRRRPLTLDLQLLQGWMEICSGDHGSKCSSSLDDKGALQYVLQSSVPSRRIKLTESIGLTCSVSSMCTKQRSRTSVMLTSPRSSTSR